MAAFDPSIAVNAVFGKFGLSATYTPAGGGDAVAVKVVPISDGDVVAQWETQALLGESHVFELRASEVATQPGKGAELVIDGLTYRVKQPARAKDARRLVWILEAPRVIA